MTPTPDQQPKRHPVWALFPVLAFAGLALLLWQGLSSDPGKIPSPLLSKPVPEFTLPPITGSTFPGLSAAQLKTGKPSLVNIWASWCAPCRQELPVLMELGKNPDLQLVGINYKDDSADALRFLTSMGNPFAAIGMDANGRVAIDWGDYGVPETFLVDGQGIIRQKFIGALDDETIRTQILPALAKMKAK